MFAFAFACFSANARAGMGILTCTVMWDVRRRLSESYQISERMVTNSI
jgi:hypothetical protein